MPRRFISRTTSLAERRQAAVARRHLRGESAQSVWVLWVSVM